MSKLRDFFASAGLCESTEDLNRKPELVEQLIKNSLIYKDGQNETSTTCPYEERLRISMAAASSYALSRLIEENVTVCMDRRLAEMEYGFSDSIVHSAYYNDGETKVLSLYDNGKNPKDTEFFEDSIIDHSTSAINRLASHVLDKKDGASPALMFGTETSLTLYETAMTQTLFEWSAAQTFKNILKNNPQIKQPPVNTGLNIDRKPSSPGINP